MRFNYRVFLLLILLCLSQFAAAQPQIAGSISKLDKPFLFRADARSLLGFGRLADAQRIYSG